MPNLILCFRLPSVLSAVVMTLLLAPAAGIAQEQLIARIGIVDLDQVARAHFGRSEALRTLEAWRQEILDQREMIEVQIHGLEQRLLDARQGGDRVLALRLDVELFDMRKYLLEFMRVKTDQLARELDHLKTSDAFIGELWEVLEYLAESRGYSLFLSPDGDLLYWAPEIDETEEIIAELARRAARR